jgi:hypothetical protein
MNKGKPSGFKADTKKDAGAKTTSRPRRGQAGVGPAVNRLGPPADRVRIDNGFLHTVAERSGADQPVNRFPEIRNGASSNGDAEKQVVHFQFTIPIPRGYASPAPSMTGIPMRRK